MFSKAKSLVKNHWRKVIYGGIAFQVASYGLQYATKRVLKHHQDKAKEVWLQMKKREHFDKIHSNVLSTFINLLPLLKDKIETSLNSEVLTASLKDKTTNKLQVWEELKIVAFSRMLSTIYGSSILCVLLNIQLSVIGGYLIQDSCSKKLGSDGQSSSSSGSTSNPVVIDTELQNEYLSLSDYFVQEGIEKLCTIIYRETKRVVGPLSLKRKLTFHDLEQILWHVIESLKRNGEHDIEVNDNNMSTSSNSSRNNYSYFTNQESDNDPIKNSWKYIFPSRILEKYGYFDVLQSCNHNRNDSSKRTTTTTTTSIDIEELIMTETYDLLKSQDVEYLMKSFETHGVSSFLDRLVDVAASSNSITTSTYNNNTSTNNNSASPTTTAAANTDAFKSNNTTLKNVIEEIPQQQEQENPSTLEIVSQSSSSPSLPPCNQNTYVLPHEVSIPLAKLIPVVNSFFPTSLNSSDPWIISITQAEKLRDFSANIYESFSSPLVL